MSELALLALVSRHPHRRALARRVRPASLFPALARLERAGLVWRRDGTYGLTVLGRRRLAFERALAAAVARALA